LVDGIRFAWGASLAHRSVALTGTQAICLVSCLATRSDSLLIGSHGGTGNCIRLIAAALSPRVSNEERLRAQLSSVVSNAAAEATRVTGATRHQCDTPAAGICHPEPALNRCGSMRLTNFHYVQRACTPPQVSNLRFYSRLGRPRRANFVR